MANNIFSGIFGGLWGGAQGASPANQSPATGNSQQPGLIGGQWSSQTQGNQPYTGINQWASQGTTYFHELEKRRKKIQDEYEAKEKTLSVTTRKLITEIEPLLNNSMYNPFMIDNPYNAKIKLADIIEKALREHDFSKKIEDIIND